MSALETLRVGRLPYLNAWPFHASAPAAEPRWITAAPRRLGELAARGELDAALLASRDALALSDSFRPLGDLGIACRGSVRSVVLFSRVPLDALGGRRIALTTESRTSRALLRILLSCWLGLHARFEDLEHGSAAPDAWLRIGDRALVARNQGEGPFQLDLGRAWADWTGLPFVYARWVVRRDLDPAAACSLSEVLARSLETPWPLPPVPPLGLSDADVAAYLDRFTYRLGPAERAGLGRFQRELALHDFHRRAATRRRVGSTAL